MRILSLFTALILSFPNVGAAQQATTPPSTSANQSPQRDPQALSILNQVLAASGGAQALSAIQDFTASGNITYFWAGDQVQGTVKVKGRSTTDFRVDASLPEGTRSWVAISGKGSLRNLDGSLVAIPSNTALN